MSQFIFPPITISSSLPAGAATSANQVLEIAALDSIDSKVTKADTDDVTVTSSVLPTGASTEATLSSLNAKVTAVNTGAVVVSSSALPSGAATSANQTTANSSLSSIDGKLTTTANGLKVDNSAVTQPISAASLPLPSGAATSANQTTAQTSLSSIVTNTANIPANLTVTSTRLLVDGSGVTQPISASALPLPSGAATSANQTTANSSLSSIDGKTPSLGQALAAASVPVVLTASQLSTLTPLTSVAVTQATAASLNATVVGTGTFAVQAAQSGTWNITNVSGTVSLPTGASTEATLNTLNLKTAGALVPTAFDYIALAYVPSGNGVGQISTATFKTGGSGGTTVKTLTLAYDSSNRITSVTAS